MHKLEFPARLPQSFQMRKLRWLTLAIACAVVLAALLWCAIPWHHGEPIYDGKPVSYWIEHGMVADAMNNLSSREFHPIISNSKLIEVEPAFFDPKAIPYLIAELHHRNTPFHKAYMNLWLNLP